LPNYGTTRYSKTVVGTLANPTTLAELFEEYKQFSLLKKKDDMNTNLDAGAPAYMVSSSWLKKY